MAADPPASRFSDCARLVAVLALVVVGMLIPLESWPALGLLICAVLAGHALAGVPVRYLARRFAFFLPFIGLLAVSVPLSFGFRGGWDIACSILLRSVLSFLAALWLVWILPFPRMLKALRRLGVPAVCIAIMTLMQRYLVVLWEELDTLRKARAARTIGPESLLDRWRGACQTIGILLIRSVRRGERIHAAMAARGWDGTPKSFEWTPSEAQRDED
jgi:cobalt/nickel transport system permease protein